MKEAIAAGDSAELGFAAHTLKGAVGNFGAKEVSQSAEKLEMMADEGKLLGAEEALAALDEKLVRLKLAMSSCYQHQPYAHSNS